MKFLGITKTVPPLLRSTSDTKLPMLSTKSKKTTQYEDKSSEDERQAVEKLTEWEKKETKVEILNSIDEATLRLNKRITGQDIVEEIIAKRKHKNKLPIIKGLW